MNKGVSYKERADDRRSKKADVQATREQKRAEKQAAEQRHQCDLSLLAAVVTCERCLEKVSNLEGKLQTHQNLHCGSKLKEPWRRKCCSCGNGGHLTGNDVRCENHGKPVWVDLSVPAQKDLASARDKQWAEEYTPRFEITQEVEMSSVSGLQNLRFALGASADDEQSVHFVMAEIGANDVTFEDSITGTVTIGTITPGSHAHCAMEVMEGMQLVWIDRSERDDWGNAAGATDALNMGCELADVEGDGQGGRTKVLLRRQEPQPMNMGYAMKPPRIVYPAMTDAQIDFLVREIEKPGRLGADAAHRSMEAKFQDKAQVLERQRIDSFISRYLQMVAGTIDFTAQVRASRGRTGVGAAVGDSGSDSDDSSNASDSGGGDSDGVTDYGGEFGTGIRSQPSERQCLEPKINTGAGIMIGTVVVAWQKENEPHELPAEWCQGKVTKHNPRTFGIEWDVSAHKGAGQVMYEAVTLDWDSYGTTGYWFMVGGDGSDSGSASGSDSDISGGSGSGTEVTPAPPGSTEAAAAARTARCLNRQKSADK